MKLLETEDYHEDFGDCLFFHFASFEEPPETYCGTPNDFGFNSQHWAYFIKDIDFNSIINQAMKLHNDGIQ